MTDLLTDTMRQRADAIDRPMVDIDAVMKAGDRRRRRRSTLAAAGAAAVCAIVAVGAVQVVGTSDGAQAPGYADGATFVDRKATYATGSTIHYGDEKIDVGEEIRSFVQTDDGFVLADPTGQVLFTNGESARPIGKADEEGRIAADESGSYVAWVDTSDDGPAEFVVYNTSTSKEIVRTSEGNRPGNGTPVGGVPNVIALDGEHAYVRNAKGFARIQIPSGHSELLRRGAGNDSEITAVENGQRLRRVLIGNPDDGEADSPWPVMRRFGQIDGLLVVAGGRDLSPDAHYVTSDANDSEQLFDTQTGDEVELDTSEYGFQAVSQWIDNDTVSLGVLEDPDAADPDVSMLTCEVPSGACDVAAEDLPSNIVLPIGGDPRP